MFWIIIHRCQPIYLYGCFVPRMVTHSCTVLAVCSLGLNHLSYLGYLVYLWAYHRWSFHFWCLPVAPRLGGSICLGHTAGLLVIPHSCLLMQSHSVPQSDGFSMCHFPALLVISLTVGPGFVHWVFWFCPGIHRCCQWFSELLWVYFVVARKCLWIL